MILHKSTKNGQKICIKTWIVRDSVFFVFFFTCFDNVCVSSFMVLNYVFFSVDNGVPQHFVVPEHFFTVLQLCEKVSTFFF